MIGSFVNRASLPTVHIAQYGSGSCVAVGPRHYLSVQHTGAGSGGTITGSDSITRNVVAATVIPASLFGNQPNSLGRGTDLQIFTVDSDLPYYHPVASAADLSYNTGSALYFGGWGETAADGVLTWTPNVSPRAEKWSKAKVDAFISNSPYAMYNSGHAGTFVTASQYACPATGDSGGGLFVNSGGVMYLIGIIARGDDTGTVTSGSTTYGGYLLDYPILNFIRQTCGLYPYWLTDDFSYQENTYSEDGAENGFAATNPGGMTATSLLGTVAYPITNVASFAITGAGTNLTKGTKHGIGTNLKDAGGNRPGFPVGTVFDQATCTFWISTSADGSTQKCTLPIFIPTWDVNNDGTDVAGFAEANNQGGALSSTYTNGSGQIGSAQTYSVTKYLCNLAYELTQAGGSANDIRDLASDQDAANISWLSWLTQTDLLSAGVRINLASLTVYSNPIFRQQGSSGNMSVYQAGVTVTFRRRRTVSGTPATPALTGASTTGTTPTSSGLVFTRGGDDGSEVDQVRITTISSGVLKTAGGTTLNVGDYITYATANAGLRFTPPSNTTANYTIGVKASIGTAGDHLSSEQTATVAQTASAAPSRNPGITANHIRRTRSLASRRWL